MIRKYQTSDCDAILDVWAGSSALAHPFLSDDFLEREREQIRNVYMPDAESWVWEADGQIVGFISLLGNEVGAIFVAPTHQRAGIGCALMNHARALRGELEVEVFQDNPVGCAFYAKYGFEPLLQKIHAPTGRMLLRLRLEEHNCRKLSATSAPSKELP